MTRRLRVADGPENLAVGTKFHPAAVMIVGAGNVVDEDFVQPSFSGGGIFAQADEPVAQSRNPGAVRAA